MPDDKPLTRSELRAIAERRRGDPDVKALLLEIRRLRELFGQASERAAGVMHYTEDIDLRHRLDQLGELFEDEADAFEPPEELRGKQDRPPVTGDAERRAQQASEDDEREAKRRARQERG